MELFDVCPLTMDDMCVVGVEALDETICLVEVCVRRERDGDDRGLELALVHGRDLPGVLLDFGAEGALNAVAGDEDCVALVLAPVLEYPAGHPRTLWWQ